MPPASKLTVFDGKDDWEAAPLTPTDVGTETGKPFTGGHDRRPHPAVQSAFNNDTVKNPDNLRHIVDGDQSIYGQPFFEKAAGGEMNNEQQAIFTVFKDMISEIKDLKEENKELRRALGSNTEALGKSTPAGPPRPEQKPPEDRVTGKG